MNSLRMFLKMFNPWKTQITFDALDLFLIMNFPYMSLKLVFRRQCYVALLAFNAFNELLMNRLLMYLKILKNSDHIRGNGTFPDHELPSHVSEGCVSKTMFCGTACIGRYFFPDHELPLHVSEACLSKTMFCCSFYIGRYFPGYELPFHASVTHIS